MTDWTELNMKRLQLEANNSISTNKSTTYKHNNDIPGITQ